MLRKLKKVFNKNRELAKKHPELLRYEELEQRVLFSADVAPGLDPASPVEQVLTEDLTGDTPIEHNAAPETAEQTAAETRRELVLVNESVADYEQLIADLEASDDNCIIDVVVLESDRDGIEQVSEILSERSDLSAVHFITHGSDGQIGLGDSWLNSATLLQKSDDVAGWGNALTETGDILFYGSNIASGTDGEVLLDDIARLTGADVAASNDVTGHTSLGGDWDLEEKRGAVETLSLSDTTTVQQWEGTLTGAIRQADFMATPLGFEENIGQTDADVDYLARGSGYSVFLTDADAVLRLDTGDGTHVLRLDVMGASSRSSVSGEDTLAGTSNYFLNELSGEGQSGVEQFGSVVYEEVYEGIDLRYYGNQRQLEYDFIVSPDSEVDQIRFGFEGSESLAISDTGELVIQLNADGDTVRFNAPIAYQTAADGTRETVDSQYVLNSDGTVSFQVADYDRTRELVIDPILDYTTFLGGTGYDNVEAVAADDAGNVYVTGWTGSTDFPTAVGALDESYNSGSYDIYVAKLSPDGSTLLYSTYIGGSGSDTANGIAIDSDGNAYITGTSTSTDFPTAGGYQTSLTGTSSAVLVKLNSTGDSLLYASYFGGTGSETAYDVALTPSGTVLITGSTNSSDLPTQNAYESTLGGTQDAFVAHFDLKLTGTNSLLYASYFGGNGSDDARSIAVDTTGAFIIGGSTSSTNLPTQNACQSSLGGGSDAYVARFDSTGSNLTYGTYLGGSGTDYMEALAIDSSGKIYAGGRTDGIFPTTAGAYDTTPGGSSDGFVAKIDPTLSGTSSLIYSTYLGSTGFDYVIGLDVDEAGSAYLAGFTGSSAFATTADANSASMTGSNDGFFAVLSADGSSLEYSTFIGGTGQDRAKDVVWNAATGSAYVGGQNALQDGPTSPVPTNIGPGGGGEDAYVAKFTFNQAPTATDDSYTVVEGGTLTGNVITDNSGTGVDSDPDGDSLTASVVEEPLHGALVLSADGSFTYTPFDAADGTNFADADQFTYQISDGKGGTDTARVTITVTPNATNEAPVNSVPDAQTTGQDVPLVFSEANGNQILVRDDAGGNTVEVILTATNGTITLAGATGLSITGGADGSETLTVQGTLADINNALDGLVFTPTATYLGSASLRIDTNDLGNAPAATPQTDNDVISIDVIAVNDPPVNTVPAAQTTDLKGMVLFSSVTGTAVSVSDNDAGSEAIQVTLTATNGTLNLSGAKDLTFSVGDGTDDATMTFTGTVADINAALEGMTFVANADFTGTAGVQITTNDLGNTGAGGALSDSDTVDITVQAVKTSLWLSTLDDVSSPGATGIESWTAGQVLQFAESGGTLSFEPGTTTGTFSLAAFDLDSAAFSDTDTKLDGIHYVTSDFSTGGIMLQQGDVLFSTQANETIGGIAYEAGDIILFRPTTAGDYSAGTFSLFFDKTDSGITVTGFTLVESAVMVGDTQLNAGDLLILEGNKDILRYVPAQLGDTTSGTESILIDGDGSLGLSKNIAAIELVEHTSVIGDKTLPAGTVILAVNGEETDGTPLNATRWDLFTLDVSTTGDGTTTASAELLFEGADVQFNDNKEAIASVSLIPNQSPVIDDQGLSVDENSANGIVVGTVTGSDPEGGSLQYAIIGGNTDGAFAIDATTGEITVANSDALDFETMPIFNLTVAAIDDHGAFGTATVTVNLNDVNEAPELDNTGDMTLTTITEDETANAGNTVAEIIASAGGNRITDVDAGAVEGIAVTGLVSSNGTWQYSIDGGGSWLDVGAVSDASALLLRATDSLRFVPDAQNADTADITFRAWDQTSGTTGTKVDASTNGETTAFSTATERASITVTAVNDAPTFDIGEGFQTTSFGVGIASQINDTTIQADGKIVAVGYAEDGNRDTMIARYNVDGSLDTSFGGGTGLVVTPVIADNTDRASNVSILDDGSILVAGTSYNGASFNYFIAKYTADGSLDGSFGGGDGIALWNLGSDYGPFMQVQDDGKILIAGDFSNNYLLARFNSDGAIDTGFGGSGYVTTDFAGSTDRAKDLAIQTDGKIRTRWSDLRRNHQ